MIKEELKPMDLGAILDKTFRLTFSNMKKYLKVFLMYFGMIFGLTFLIVAVVVGFLIANGFDFDNFSQTDKIIPFILTIIPVSFFTFIILIYISIVYTGMITDIFVKSFIGEEWNFKSSYKFVKSKFWTIIIAGILCSFLFVGGLLICCVGILPIMALISLVIPAIIFEKENSTGSISRSFKLVSYSFWRVFGSVLLFFLIILFLSMIIQIGFRFIPLSIQSLNRENNILMIIIISIISIVSVIISLAYNVLSSALGAAFYVLIFFNQKIKFENFGVELLADSITEEKPPVEDVKK